MWGRRKPIQTSQDAGISASLETQRVEVAAYLSDQRGELAQFLQRQEAVLVLLDDKIASVLNGLEQEKSSKTKKFFLSSIAAALFFLASGSITAYFGLQGFTKPIPGRNNGSITLVTDRAPLSDSAAVSYDSFGDHELVLSVNLPSDALAHKWALILEGDARVSSAVPVDTRYPVTIDNTSCTAVTRFATLTKCQAIIGNAAAQPFASAVSSSTGCYDNGTPSVFQSKVEPIYIHVFLRHAVNSGNWAVKSITLPSIQTLDNINPLSFRNFTDPKIGKPIFEASLSSLCQTFAVPEGYSYVDSKPTPTNSDKSAAVTFPNLDTGVTPEIEVRSNSADFWQNLWIVTAGILLAIGGGFIPIILQTWLDGYDVRIMFWRKRRDEPSESATEPAATDPETLQGLPDEAQL